MKKAKYILPLITTIFLFSCGAEPTVEETENPFEELNEVFENLNEELSEIDGIQEIYTITSESAGDFILGGPIPESNDAYEVIAENVILQTEEGPYEELIYTVANDQEELVRITREFDAELGDYKTTIGELIIQSDRFETVDGIGVGNTISEFVQVYPDYKIWYTYVSDSYVIETKGLRAQFRLDGSGFTGEINDFGEVSGLKHEDFKPDTEITSIRMYKI